MYMRNRGLHWRNHSNPRLQKLAEANAWRYADPWITIEDEDELPRSIGVVFGSSPADVTLRLIDSEVEGLFLHGYCGLLAWAIHKNTGHPIVLFTTPTETGWSGHAVVQVGVDAYLDITGVRTADDIHRSYPTTGEPEVITSDEYRERLASNDHKDDPLMFIDELERLVLEDFAEFVMDEYKDEIIDARNAAYGGA